MPLAIRFVGLLIAIMIALLLLNDFQCQCSLKLMFIILFWMIIFSPIVIHQLITSELFSLAISVY